jgi:hypothetical protein
MKLLSTAVVGAMAYAAVLLDGQGDTVAPRAVRPVDGILSAFSAHNIVALSDGRFHGDGIALALRLSLVQDSRIASTVNDIVLEAGSSRFQEVIDRYVRGGLDLSDEALQQPWTESTQPQLVLNTLSGADRLLREVRRVNAARPATQQLRVLLGDPPIDWESVHSQADHRRWIEQRDRFAADLILREVVAKGRRALVIFGGGHLQRFNQQANYDMSSDLAQTVVSLLEKDRRTRLFVVRSEYDFPALVTDVGRWPVPSFAALPGTTLGLTDEPPTGIAARASIDSTGNVRPVPRAQWARLPLEKQADAVIYYGPLDASASDNRATQRCEDREYMNTHVNRLVLVGAPQTIIEELRRLCAARVH